MSLPNWTPEAMKPIQEAVDREIQRIKIAAKFLPLPLDAVTPGATTVLSDIITIDQQKDFLMIDEGETTSFYQITVKFKLSDSQYSDPSGPKTAITLATRAANLLSQAEDILIFQGEEGESNTIFTLQKVIIQQKGRQSPGLLQLKVSDSELGELGKQSIEVFYSSPGRYGENTFSAVSEGYSTLQDLGHYGPYALVLHDRIYADTHAPLATTLIMPADRIKSLVTFKDVNNKVSEMYYGTGTLPILKDDEEQIPTGLLVSLGGNTMDLVIKTPPTVSQLPYETGFYPFQVTEQFALRLKDKTSVIRFKFKPRTAPGSSSGGSSRSASKSS